MSTHDSMKDFYIVVSFQQIDGSVDVVRFTLPEGTNPSSIIEEIRLHKRNFCVEDFFDFGEYAEKILNDTAEKLGGTCGNVPVHGIWEINEYEDDDDA